MLNLKKLRRDTDFQWVKIWVIIHTHTEWGIYFVNPVFCLNKHTKINFLTKLFGRIKIGGTFHLLHNSNVYIYWPWSWSLCLFVISSVVCIESIEWNWCCYRTSSMNRFYRFENTHTIIISACVQTWACRASGQDKSDPTTFFVRVCVYAVLPSIQT